MFRYRICLPGCCALLLLAAACTAPSRPPATAVNLALRYTADRLLRLEGDSTTAVSPVRQTDENTYVVVLPRTFNYDSLPALLERGLSRHGIRREYLVSVVDCSDAGNLILGYALRDYQEGDGVPCGGRDRTPGCYNLRVSFLPPVQTSRWAALGWLGAGTCGLLLMLSFLALRRNQRGSAGEGGPPVAGNLQPFGNSALDFDNLLLWTGGQSQRLTYREAKLLRYFVGHPNVLLERERILQAVWEDEGLMVGRSLDMFVSRLRKLLKADHSVAIGTVHGLGYRLEVGS